MPNIVLVLIDPISRPHFHRSMPKTSAALERLGFTHFGNYSSIGPNSGKNQAGLYSGMPLANRDGIKRDTEGQKWLWDELQGNGFVTLKAENGEELFAGGGGFSLCLFHNDLFRFVYLRHS